MHTNEFDKLNQALYNIVSLEAEVHEGLFLPKRFRTLTKAELPQALATYTAYLQNEAIALQKRLDALFKSHPESGQDKTNKTQ